MLQVMSSTSIAHLTEIKTASLDRNFHPCQVNLFTNNSKVSPKGKKM